MQYLWLGLRSQSADRSCVKLEVDMALASVFSPAFKHNLVSKSASYSSSKLARKRKRGNDSSESQSNDENSEAWKTTRESNSITPSSNFRPSAARSLSSDRQDTAQFHAAGQPLDRSLLERNLPQALPTLKTERLRELNGQLEDKLAVLKPPLYLSSRFSWRGPSRSGISVGSFRRRHLAALTTILHRCMSEGDYCRAGRAWAILVRFEINGHSLDIRNDDQWGTGAEILYQRSILLDGKPRDNELSNPPKDDKYQNHGLDGTGLKLKRLHSRSCFQETQEYYERLTLQYPYQKTFSNAVNVLDFWPASYALWIRSLHDRHGRSSKFAKPLCSKSKNDIHQMANPIETTSLASPIVKNCQRMVEVDRVALRHGNDIAERLDELLSSPPHSDDPRLWSIRGMVALWVADLSITPVPSASGTNSSIEEDDQMINNDGEVMWNSADGSLTEAEYIDNLQKRPFALEKAKAAFEKVSRLRNPSPAHVDR